MVVSDKNTRIYIKIPKDFHEWLKEQADIDDRNVSNLVYTILKKYRQEREKNLPSK